LSDTTVNGLHLKRGELIIVDIAKANRDPVILDTPNKFDIARVESKHLAFGYGHHFCIGSRLSVLELKIVLQNLIGGSIDLRRLGKPIPLTNTLYKGFSCLPMEMVRPL
jgi:cytochrome P450